MYIISAFSSFFVLHLHFIFKHFMLEFKQIPNHQLFTALEDKVLGHILRFLFKSQLPSKKHVQAHRSAIQVILINFLFYRKTREVTVNVAQGIFFCSHLPSHFFMESFSTDILEFSQNFLSLDVSFPLTSQICHLILSTKST